MDVQDSAALAMLAEAAYANFENTDTEELIRTALQRIGTDEDESDDPDKGFSLTQAEKFTEKCTTNPTPIPAFQQRCSKEETPPPANPMCWPFAVRMVIGIW
ncbi:MAG: hypothetical protein KZQ78_04285 [Candidatus Thiodiazotropha sp. (ex Ustalcina ferruginea)]|nr:hypothetical protein [Candidatus Thiodiazotropha sp. (ex Ustalcina ferruginea)]